MDHARTAAAAGVVTLTLTAMLVACAAQTAPETGARRELLALEADESWEGKTLEEWAVEYMRWYYSPTACEAFPSGDPDGSACGDYQDPNSPVFFLERSALGEGVPMRVERTRCRVPAGKALFVPVSSFAGDKAGMRDPMSDEEIESTIRDVKRSMREPILKADGKDLSETLTKRALGPIRYSYRVPPAPNRYGCDNSKMVSDIEVDPSFVAGIFVLFQPPTLGPHELEYASVLTFFERDYSFHVHSKFEVVESD